MSRALPRLVLITDPELSPETTYERAARALEAGPGIAVQLRRPGAMGRALYLEARALADLCARHRAPFFVNGRLDVALLVGAHLHLPVDAPAADEVRPHLPPDRWVSVAVHHDAELERARGADLALVSPVWSPGSKAHDARPCLGPEGFARLAQRLPCPAFALGGVDAAKLSGLGGSSGAAVVSSVFRASDPKRAAAELLAAVTTARQPSAVASV